MGKMMGAKEVSALLGVSESKAYGYIRAMNEELSNAGFLTVRGKCPQAYIEKRLFGFQESQKEGGANGKP